MLRGWNTNLAGTVWGAEPFVHTKKVPPYAHARSPWSAAPRVKLPLRVVWSDATDRLGAVRTGLLSTWILTVGLCAVFPALSVNDAASVYFPSGTVAVFHDNA